MRYTIIFLLMLPSLAQANDRLWRGICKDESHNTPKAVGDHSDGIGIAQINPVMVKECNRLAGRQRFTLADRWSVRKSKQMFDLYMSQWPLASSEVKARRWNGGPMGDRKPNTRMYWKKVKRAMQ
jgi:hypothetical protein